MKFPHTKILQSDTNKYEISVAMMKYAEKIIETPELLLEYSERDRDKKVAIIINDILEGKIKYHRGE
ncbi:MAG: hypothetical protein JW827_02000 [Spirochaetes bacterium]|nr:hypothetical protein [Spirochaetota bacterium]